MTSSDYLLWQIDSVPNACRVGGLKNVEKVFQLKNGLSRAVGFEEDACFEMDPDFPHDTMLVDVVDNTDEFIIASSRLKQFFEERQLKFIEYLPVAIKDHKGRVASREYFLVHPVDPVDCLDLDACRVTWSLLVPDKIDTLERVVIDLEKLEPGRELFRPKRYPRIILVRRDLAAAIDEAGFDGVRWTELQDFGKPLY